MVGPWPHKPFTFCALIKAYGPMWVRCDVCRRYGPFRIGGLGEVDYRPKNVQLLSLRRRGLPLRGRAGA